MATLSMGVSMISDKQSRYKCHTRKRCFLVTLFLLTFTRKRERQCASQSRACDTRLAVYETCPELRAQLAEGTRPPAEPPLPPGVHRDNDGITTADLMSGSVDRLICATGCDIVRFFINSSRAPLGKCVVSPYAGRCKFINVIE